MSDSNLYDDDILLWSEQQAEVIRKLKRTVRDLPNDLDVENVAEEIESVGRSELAAVKSYVRLILTHLIKMSLEADGAPTRHWRQEVGAFHADLLDRYAPSMHQRIDMNEVWQSARDQVSLGYEGAEEQWVKALPNTCPLSLDDVVGSRLDSVTLVERLKRTIPASGR